MTDTFHYCLTIRDAFKRGEVDAMLRFKEKIKPEPGRVDDVFDKDLRESTIRWINLDDDSRWLFAKLGALFEEVNKQYFRFDIDHTELLQLTEYPANVKGHYGAHVDCGHGDAAFRKLSMTLQLTEGSEYEGGDLVLYGVKTKPIIAARELGAITIFNSLLLHEVTPVTAGVRDSLVTWARGPAWR